MQVGHDLVEQHEEHENKRDHHPEAGIVQRVHDRLRYRQVLRYYADNRSSGDDEHEAAHDRNKKACRNAERNEHVLDHAARDFDVVNVVYRAHHRAHRTRQKIQRQAQTNDHRAERRRAGQLLDIPAYQLLQTFRQHFQHRLNALDGQIELRENGVDEHQQREHRKQQKIRKFCRRLRDAVIKKAVNHTFYQI